MYAKYFKRVIDFIVALTALIVLFVPLLILTVLGAIMMKGNPFFTQPRPGKDEKVFRLIKFRTMTHEKGADGKLLPDEQRITGYGRFLRGSSLDELPELINILLGHPAIEHIPEDRIVAGTDKAAADFLLCKIKAEAT